MNELLKLWNLLPWWSWLTIYLCLAVICALAWGALCKINDRYQQGWDDYHERMKKYWEDKEKDKDISGSK